MDEQNLTTKEAAVRLGISAGRIRQLVLAGGLPAQKFGRDLMIKVSDLNDVTVYGKRGRPSKRQASTDGEASALDAPDNGTLMPAKKPAGKKATAKASKR